MQYEQKEFDQNEYSVNPVKRKPLTFWIEVGPDKSVTTTYSIQTKLVESDHGVGSLGLIPEKYEYYSIQKTFENESKATGILSMIIFSLD